MGLAGSVSGVGAGWRGTVLVVVGGAFGRRGGVVGVCGSGFDLCLRKPRRLAEK